MKIDITFDYSLRFEIELYFIHLSLNLRSEAQDESYIKNMYQYGYVYVAKISDKVSHIVAMVCFVML